MAEPQAVDTCLWPHVQRRYSVAKIETSTSYEKGRPKPNGLSDPRLGTMDRALKCTTDGAGVQDCPGYFGHIELAKPMYHVGFMSTTIKVLRCVSYHNSKLLIDKVRGIQAQPYSHGSWVSLPETSGCSLSSTALMCCKLGGQLVCSLRQGALPYCYEAGTYYSDGYPEEFGLLYGIPPGIA